MPARIQILASDGRGYVPADAFHRVSPASEIHYFHSTGEFEVMVPAGGVRVEALPGFEWIPADETVRAAAGGTTTVELRMERLSDPGQSNWVSGDTHVHDLHEGRYGLSQQEFFDQLRADDLHVTNDLIHMDGTKIMGRWRDLTGEDYSGSTDDYILRYTQEFRGSLGHVGLLGVSEFIMPLIGGTSGSPYPADGLKLMYLDSIRALGGIGGFMHPYTLGSGTLGTPEWAAQSDIPIHAILGRGGFYDVVSIASDEMVSSDMYYHMLNVGARLPSPEAPTISRTSGGIRRVERHAPTLGWMVRSAGVDGSRRSEPGARWRRMGRSCLPKWTGRSPARSSAAAATSRRTWTSRRSHGGGDRDHRRRVRRPHDLCGGWGASADGAGVDPGGGCPLDRGAGLRR